MAAARRPRQSLYTFTLILAGATEPTDALQGALNAAGCDDALLGSRNGVLFLDFDRVAPTLADAIESAIGDVESSSAGLSVVRVEVEPDELVTTAEIAERLGRARETVRLYALGLRGPGGFPQPVARARNRSPLYRWADVAGWSERIRPLAGGQNREVDATIGYINAALEVRRLEPAVPESAKKLGRSIRSAKTVMAGKRRYVISKVKAKAKR